MNGAKHMSCNNLDLAELLAGRAKVSSSSSSWVELGEAVFAELRHQHGAGSSPVLLQEGAPVRRVSAGDVAGEFLGREALVVDAGANLLVVAAAVLAVFDVLDHGADLGGGVVAHCFPSLPL